MKGTKPVALFVLAVASFSASQAAAARFYLATERVFAPGEPVEVKLEANSVASIEVRVYRIPDPRAYFDAQADLHRPETDGPGPRPKVLSILERGAKKGLSDLRNKTRKMFGRSGRGTLRSAFEELHDQAISGAEGTETQIVLPPLENFELLDAFDHDLPDRSGWTYDQIPIPVTEPGAYLVEAASAEQVANTVVLVTDVALVTKQSSRQLMVWAVDPASGDPRPGTRIAVLSEGKVQKESESDGDGLVRFDLGLLTSPVIYGMHGASFTLLDPRFFPANLPEPRVYLFSERPVYRAGQEVFVKGFARDMDGEEYRLPAAESPVHLEIVDPKGQVFESVDLKISDRGSFDARFELPEDPRYGTWQMVATYQGKRHAGEFKVMAFSKPEVQLSVRVAEKSIRNGDPIRGDVVGAYFFGAPYPGAPVKLTLTRTRFYIPWYVDAEYAWYYSEAEYKNTRREILQEAECTLDDRGECAFSLATAPGSDDYTYVVEAVAQDPSGRTILGSSDVRVTRGAFHLTVDPPALVAAPQAKQMIKIRAEDYAQKPVQTSVLVVVSAKHVAQDGRIETVEVLRGSIKTNKEGRAAVEIEPKRAGYYEIKASSKDDRGTEITADAFLFVSKAGGDLPLQPAGLEIVTDKKSYFAGETALVLILAPQPEARILFTVEGGDLYQSRVVAAKRYAVLTQVQITEKQAPNFFLGAVAVSGGQVFTKERSVIVPPREKLLTVEVAPDKSDVRPQDKVRFTVHVTDHRGKPVEGAEVALSVVDEAIFSVSPEIAVQLEAFFHHRKRNDVRTTDSVSYRFFGSSRALKETALRDPGALFSYGSMKPQADEDRKTFKDTAGWFPALLTDREGRAAADVTMPDNLTAWRATARVMSRDTRVGMSTAKVRVKKPVIVRLALPASVVEGDRGSGAVVLQNLSGQSGRFHLALRLRSRSAGLFIAADDAQPIEGREVDVRDRETLRIPFTYTASGSGSLELIARARGPGGELLDGIETKMEVRPWSIVRRLGAGGRTSGDVPSAEHVLEVPRGTELAEAEVEIEIAPSAMAAVRATIPYLMGFPYGCTEQTMSRFLPVLAIARALRDLKVPADAEIEKTLPSAVASGLGRLAQLEHADGGWGWWAEDTTDPRMTALVLEGLGEARSLGESVDASMVERGLNALQDLLSTGSADPNVRAYALYALAKHGRKLAAMLSALDAERSKLGAQALAHLALAATASGESEIAVRAFERLFSPEVMNKEEGGAIGWGEGDRESSAPVETTATVLRALAAARGDPKLIAAAGAYLMEHFDGERFGSTRATALVVRAFAAQASISESGETAIRVLLDGKEIASHVFSRKETSEPAVRLRPHVVLSSRKPRFAVEEKGAGVFFHTVALKVPMRAKLLEAEGVPGLSVKRTYRSLSGATGAYVLGRAEDQFKSGAALLVTLTIDADKAIDHLVVEDPHPSGVSAIERDAGLQVEGVELSSPGVHREHREDRTAFFLSRLKAGRTTLHYLARADLPGTYKVLPAKVEAMYLPSTYHAQSASDVLKVVKR